MAHEPAGFSGFLRYYFRHGYPLVVPGVVVYSLLRGSSAVEAIWFGAAGLVLSIILALFGLRRKRRIESYARPRRATTAGLPPSAVVEPDTRERRRGTFIVWWALVLVGTAGSGWGLTQAFGSGVDDEDFGLAHVLILVVAMLWTVWMLHFLWTRPALIRSALLAERNPDARVMTFLVGTFNGIGCGLSLRRVCHVRVNWWRARLPMHTTAVVDSTGIELWRGWIRPRMQYFVPWEVVGRVDTQFVEVTGSSVGDPGLGISMDLRVVDDGRFAGWAALEFRPTRSTIWMTYPYRKTSIVEAFAEAIDELRPGRDRLVRGLTLAEWKDAVEGAEAEGDVESVKAILAEVRDWRDSRGGYLPGDGGWLRERLGEPAG